MNQSEPPLNWRNLLVSGAWFGLLYGIAEGALLLTLYEFSDFSMWRNGGSPPVLWVAPVVNLVLFLLLSAGLALGFRVMRLGQKEIAWPLSAAVFWGVVAFGLLMSPRALKFYGCAFLALGFMAQGYRWARKRRPFVFLRRSLVPLAAVVLILGLGSEGWVRWQERAFYASLPQPRPGAPNVLLVIADTLRADHLSSDGYPRRTTPNLDRLAAEGLFFEKAFAPYHWTRPSHVGILAGFEAIGVPDQELRSEKFQAFLPITLASQGFATMASSANSMWCTPKAGLGRGFARFDVYFHNVGDGISRTFYGKMLATAYRWYGGYFDVPGRKLAEDVNEEFFAWIDNRRPANRPFFVMLNYFDVHTPYLAPPPFRTQFSSQVSVEDMLALHRSRELRTDLSDAEIQLLIDSYDGSLAYLDHWLGKLFEGLRQRGILDQTLVIFTSDHGEALGEQGRFDHVAPIMRQEVLRVPLILRYPERISAGSRVAYPVALRQIPATVADVLRLGSNSPYSGRSLLATSDPPTPVLVKMGRLLSLASDRWHYMVRPNRQPELYDLDADPREEANLAGHPDFAGIESRLQAEMKTLAEELEKKIKLRRGESE